MLRRGAAYFRIVRSPLVSALGFHYLYPFAVARITCEGRRHLGKNKFVCNAKIRSLTSIAHAVHIAPEQFIKQVLYLFRLHMLRRGAAYFRIVRSPLVSALGFHYLCHRFSVAGSRIHVTQTPEYMNLPYREQTGRP